MCHYWAFNLQTMQYYYLGAVPTGVPSVLMAPYHQWLKSQRPNEWIVRTCPGQIKPEVL